MEDGGCKKAEYSGSGETRPSLKNDLLRSVELLHFVRIYLLLRTSCESLRSGTIGGKPDPPRPSEHDPQSCMQPQGGLIEHSEGRVCALVIFHTAKPVCHQ